jgi:hypothetical protein
MAVTDAQFISLRMNNFLAMSLLSVRDDHCSMAMQFLLAG